MQKNPLLPPDLLHYHSTPLQEITDHPVCMAAGVRLIVKREDLNHPVVSGNKWWKLKYNLEAAVRAGHKTILTFGGAYSNHIYATAAAAKAAGLNAIGIIRGEETLPLNHTLAFAREQGMTISYVGRSAYRTKTSAGFIESLHRQYGEFFLIPEGGSNHLALKGCLEFAREQLSKIDFDHLFIPVGTGGTVAGVISGLGGRRNVIGVSVLKGHSFLKEDIAAMVSDFSGKAADNWSLLTTYHGGGYAKTSPRLVALIEDIKNSYGLPLDHVYTGKLFMAMLSEVAAGAFSRGSTILLLHTGGLQGGKTTANKAP